MVQKKFNFKKDSFFYEGYVWNHSLNIIHDIQLNYLDKNSNAIAIKYAKTLNIMSSLYRNLTFKKFDFIKIWYWYYLYYIKNIYFKNLINKNNNYVFEKPNIFVFNIKSKQIRLAVLTSKNYVYNLTVGKILSSLNIKEKSKKKSNKGERLFSEYLENFFKNKNIRFGTKKLAIIKLKYFKKGFKLHESIFKTLNKNLFIINTIYDFKVPNNFFKFKKIRSIKKRIKKKLIKDENTLNF
uniref:Ymf61 n=1 Tax=Tetrahymena thermophila TaxID=5911 RepID=Q950Z8_TETTH|nr:ymf61 [Tetrahymena thermophila]AAK77585.1 ymf61 [Tetrahymena thermophila]6Z1P_Bk Chain Bk, Ymf61 [Tetrahymena thermophila SB210]